MEKDPNIERYIDHLTFIQKMCYFESCPFLGDGFMECWDAGIWSPMICYDLHALIKNGMVVVADGIKEGKENPRRSDNHG